MRSRTARRAGVIGCLSAFTLASLLAVGTAVYAGEQVSSSTASASGSAAASSALAEYPSTWSAPGGSFGYALPGSGSGSGSGGTSTATTATTDAVPASTGQTAGVVTIVTELAYQGASAAGTGVVRTSDGLILTNNHVIEGSTAIEVTDELTGASYTATVVGTDATNDIAVLQLEGASGLATAALAADSDSDGVTDAAGTSAVAIGDAVTAVGNAEGTGDLVAASGTVTALDQTITTQSESGAEGETLTGLIQVDADIVSGDSGGPLLDAAGAVVGINTAASSGSADITGFTIPISTALDIVAQIESGVETDTVQIGASGFLGVALAQDAATSLSGSASGSGAGRSGGRGSAASGSAGSGSAGSGSAASGSAASGSAGSATSGSAASGSATSGSATSGATIAGVYEGTPAATAGLAAGDTITAVNGTAVTSAADLSALVAATEPGEQLTLTWTTAAGTTASATLTLTEAPAA